jgi:predicted nucleic acid-binding protein
MKALDTPVLLALLHGGKGARELVRRLKDVEVATTELNLLELSAIAARTAPAGRAHRREAIDRLRRIMLVLPYDNRAAERVSRRTAREDLRKVPPLLLGALGILEANGCEEFVTQDPGAIQGKWQFRVTKFDERGA